MLPESLQYLTERPGGCRYRCVAEAAALGITLDDMEPEWGSVETIIYEAMENDIEAELEFWKKFAAKRQQGPVTN